MSNQFRWFLISSAVFVGSFSATYFRNNPSILNQSVLAKAQEVVNRGGADPSRLPEAAELLRLEIEKHPAHLTALFLQGRVQQQRGLIDLAIQSYEKYFSEKVSIDFAASFNLAELYELRGEVEKAEKFFEQCVGVAPLEATGWERLINVKLKRGKKDEAYVDYTSMKELLSEHSAVQKLAPLFP